MMHAGGKASVAQEALRSIARSSARRRLGDKLPERLRIELELEAGDEDDEDEDDSEG